MFPEHFTIDEIRWAAHGLPMRVEKHPEGGSLVRRVSFQIHAEHVSSVMQESTSGIDLDKAVLNGVKRQLADTLTAELQNRMREARQEPARRQFFEARNRWLEKMLRVYADPDARRQVDFVIDGLENRERFHAQG